VNCPNVGHYYFEAVPKGVTSMTAETAEADAYSWFSSVQTAYKTDFEAKSIPTETNDETLLSYYKQGGIVESDLKVNWKFDTTHEKKYVLTLVCIDVDDMAILTSIDYTAKSNNGVVLSFDIQWEKQTVISEKPKSWSTILCTLNGYLPATAERVSDVNGNICG
jgi:hypothetical protein